MSEDRNEPASNTPPPLVPPPVRGPETRSNETVSNENTSGDADRDSTVTGDETASARTADRPAEQSHDVPSDDSRFAPEASRATASAPAAAGDRDAAQRDAEQSDAAQRDAAQRDAERPVAAEPVIARETEAQSTEARSTAAQPAAAVPRDEPTRSQPTVPAAQPTVPAQQPERVFVPPAPVAPKRKGNRGIGSLIAIVSVVIFGILYALVATVIVAVAAPQQNVLTTLTRFLVDPVFYVPGILFVVGFVLVVLLVNRAAWWAFVLGSLIVGAIVYFGTIGVQLLTENVVTMTPTEAMAAFAGYAANPFVIAAALVARETSMWIGAAISSRGRRMRARNLTAREEFDKATAAHRAEYDRSYAA